MTSEICIKAIISGKVQGVAYRANAFHQAKTLNLTGWIKNTKTGQVELLACGTKEAITKFTTWLWQGPKMARVEDVDWKEIPPESHESFEITW